MALLGRRLLVVCAAAAPAREVVNAAILTGADVVICSNGREALEESIQQSADAAIVGLPLPDVRAEDVLEALQGRDIPCVAFETGSEGAGRNLDRARECAAAFFDRPADICEVFATLELLVETRGQQQFPRRREVRTERDPAPSPDQLANDPSEDFDCLVFSRPRPALDEAVAGTPLGVARDLLFPPVRPATPGRAFSGSRPPPPLPRGTFHLTTAPRLLMALRSSRAMGALSLVHDTVRKMVLFEEGRIIFALSNLRSERFGPRCVAEGIISETDLEEITLELDSHHPVAEELISRGLLDEPGRSRLVQEQVRCTVWSMLGWTEGSYEFISAPITRRPVVVLSLDPRELVFEGIRRTATLASLHEALPERLTLASRQGVSLPARLSEAERSMLDNADGTKYVSDLVLLSGLPERDALACLHACREIGLLDEVEQGLAGTGRIRFM